MKLSVKISLLTAGVVVLATAIRCLLIIVFTRRATLDNTVNTGVIDHHRHRHRLTSAMHIGRTVRNLPSRRN